jgi:hypothetical protein
MPDAMNPDPLPSGLRELEDQLARRPCPEPAADFRACVLSAVMNSPALTLPGHADRRWSLIWQAAAAVVLALNLGMSVANGIRFQRLAPPPAVEGNLVHRGVPGVPDEFDASDRFHVLTASALASLRPAPDVGALGRNLFSNGEERGWATP